MEVKALTAQYAYTHNQILPHSSLGYRPPVPEPILPTGSLPALVPPTGLLVQEMWAGQNQP